MNDDYTQSVSEQEQGEQGFPVDLTEDEFLAFSMAVARKMGPLKSQKPLMILFAVYLLVEVVGLIKTYADTGTLSLSLLVMVGLTAVCAALSMTMMPARIKKGAKASFAVGNRNGYYGEVTVTPYAIMKNIGEETVSIPFNEQTLYIEDREFMAFTAAGQQRSIILPARCMTTEMAVQVRQAVFAQNVPIARRVFARMEARAQQPIARRAFPEAAHTLYALDFQYTEQELTKLYLDTAWKQYFQTLPGLSMMAVIAGLLMAFLQENAWWFPGVSLTFIFGYMVLSILSASARGKKAAGQVNRTHLVLTDRGVEMRVSPSGQRLSIGWSGIERAVERETCVELFHSGGHLLRIPKRAIEDFEEFRSIVDGNMKK